MGTRAKGVRIILNSDNLVSAMLALNGTSDPRVKTRRILVEQGSWDEIKNRELELCAELDPHHTYELYICKQKIDLGIIRCVDKVVTIDNGKIVESKLTKWSKKLKHGRIIRESKTMGARKKNQQSPSATE